MPVWFMMQGPGGRRLFVNLDTVTAIAELEDGNAAMVTNVGAQLPLEQPFERVVTDLAGDEEPESETH